MGSITPSKFVRPMRLAERIAEEIGTKIREGSLKAGDRLPNTRDLAKSLDVSPSAVRHGLTILQQAGLVQVIHGVGTFVRSNVQDLWDNEIFSVQFLDVADLIALLEVRIGIESEAASLAAARRSDEELDGMRRAFLDLREHVANRQLGDRPDYQFHKWVAAATHNKMYSELIDFVGQQFRRGIAISRARSLTVPGRSELVLAEHERVLAAIEAGDPERARLAMREHIESARHRIREAGDDAGE